VRTRVFVLSCGRAGSTALAEYVREIEPSIDVAHEPPLWLLLRRTSVRLFARKTSPAAGARLLQLLRWRELRRVTGTHIDTTPALWGFTGILPKVFPSCRLIHIVRDPADYALSAVRFRSFSHVKGLIADAVPDLVPTPNRDDEPPRWRDMTPVQRAVWFWSTVNGYIEREARSAAVPVQRFRFEDLFGEQSKPDAVRTLATGLNLSDSRRLAQRLCGAPINATPRRGDTHQREIREAVAFWAGTLARRYGYPVE